MFSELWFQGIILCIALSADTKYMLRRASERFIKHALLFFRPNVRSCAGRSLSFSLSVAQLLPDAMAIYMSSAAMPVEY